MSAKVTTYSGTDAVWTKNGDAVPKFAAINASSNGSNTVISGTSGKKIIVLSYFITVASAVSATWESSNGDLHSGAVPIAANGGAVCPFNPVGWFKTTSGYDLVLYLSSGVQVSGHLTYVLE